MHQHKLVTPSLNWNDLQCLNCHCFSGRWHNTEICINVHNIYVFLIAVKEIIIIISSVNLIYRRAARSVTMSLYFTGHMPHGMDGGKYRCMFWHLWCLICFLNRFPLKMLRSEEKTIKCKQVVSYKIADFYHFIMIFKRLFVNILRHLSSLHKLDFTRFCFQIQLIPIQHTWM